MNIHFLWIGGVEIVFALVVALLVFVIGFQSLSLFTREYNDVSQIKDNNIAVAIITAAFLLGIGLLLKAAMGPSTTVLRNALMDGAPDMGRVFSTLGYLALHLLIAGFTAVVVLFISIFLFTLVSPFKDLKAVMNNNIAVALIIGTLMIITVLLVTDPLTFLLEGFMPDMVLPRAVR